MAKFLLLLLGLGGVLAACTRDEPRALSSTAIPAQHRDPELRAEGSASAGASRPAVRAAVTDLGREAEKEEEEHLRRQKAGLE